MFGYSKQAYYKQHTQQTTDSIKQKVAQKLILEIRKLMPRIGTRKLHHMLKEDFEREQITLGRDRLFAMLKAEGLLIHKVKRYTITTNSKHWLHKYPNMTKDLLPTRPEQLWVADITYIDTQQGFRYLHLITDAYSKQIVGYEFCDNMEATSTLKALIMALSKRQYPEKELIHHSDRGLQYCSKLYTQTLQKHNIQISMTENGDPYENPVAERVNGILKDEFGLGERFEDDKQCQKQINQSIITYNNLRPHLSCQMMTPEHMHKQQEIKIKTWKKKTTNSKRVA